MRRFCSVFFAIEEKTPEEMTPPVYRPFKDGPFQMTMGVTFLFETFSIDFDFD